MTIRLKDQRHLSPGFVCFTDKQAAMLGYVKAPDAWVKTVYKFPLKLRIKAFFYRLYVRLHYGIPSGEMWWTQDEGFSDLVESMPIGWTGDDPFQSENRPVPSIGNNVMLKADAVDEEGWCAHPIPIPMPAVDLAVSRDQEEKLHKLQKLLEVSNKFSGTSKSLKERRSRTPGGAAAWYALQGAKVEPDEPVFDPSIGENLGVPHTPEELAENARRAHRNAIRAKWLVRLDVSCAKAIKHLTKN
jgi:hypothetical protein